MISLQNKETTQNLSHLGSQPEDLTLTMQGQFFFFNSQDSDEEKTNKILEILTGLRNFSLAPTSSFPLRLILKICLTDKS